LESSFSYLGQGNLRVSPKLLLGIISTLPIYHINT
jgi:hypothetical protein